MTCRKNLRSKAESLWNIH